MSKVFIALGSNLGEREKNIEMALAKIAEAPEIRIIKISSNYETEPEGFTEQNKFINTAAELETSLEPLKLLAVLQGIEQAMGRVKTKKWGPRNIDLDILLYDNQKINEENLIIPHPRMLARQFVLKPLAEIAPDLVSKLIK